MISLELHAARRAHPLSLRRVRDPVIPKRRPVVVRVPAVHADKVLRRVLVHPALVRHQRGVGRALFLANVAAVALLGVSAHVPLPGALGAQLDVALVAGELDALVHHPDVLLQVRVGHVRFGAFLAAEGTVAVVVLGGHVAIKQVLLKEAFVADVAGQDDGAAVGAVGDFAHGSFQEGFLARDSVGFGLFLLVGEDGLVGFVIFGGFRFGTLG